MMETEFRAESLEIAQKGEPARHLTAHGVNRNEDGAWSWKFDSHVRVFAATGLPERELHALWGGGRIACPVLLVRGAESWASDPREAGRRANFRNVRCVDIEGAGHWSHHDRFDVVLAELRAFLAGSEPARPLRSRSP